MKKIILLLILLATPLAADNNYLSEGIKLYEKKEFDKARFKFEQDLVFNPKSERSYLYLAKIFKQKEEDDLSEINLNTVVLLNPQNEEAIYELILLKIKKSDFEETKKLINDFSIICNLMCDKKKGLNNLLSNSLKK